MSTRSTDQIMLRTKGIRRCVEILAYLSNNRKICDCENPDSLLDCRSDSSHAQIQAMQNVKRIRSPGICEGVNCQPSTTRTSEERTI